MCKKALSGLRQFSESDILIRLHGFNSISYPKIIPGSQMHKKISLRFKRVYLYLQTNIAGKEVIVKNPRVLDKKQIQGGMEKPLHSMSRCL